MPGTSTPPGRFAFELARPPCDPARGSRKLSVPTATRDAPAATNSAASAPLATPPMPIRGISTAAPTARSWCSATVRTAGPERPPLPAASAGSAAGRVERRRLERVDQRDRVGPALLGGDRDRGGLGDVGRQLHDQRLRGQRPQRRQQRLGLGRLLADDQAGVDVRAGDVELDRGDLLPLRRRPRPAGRTARGSSPSPRRSAAPAARRAAAGPRRGSRRGPCWAARSS